MYSVEDLLISHGYKVSGNNKAPPSRSPSVHEQQPLARSKSRCEIMDKRTGQGTANGYKVDCVQSGVRQTSSKGGTRDSESRDRNQRTKEVDNSNPVDGHLPGDTVTSNRGLHDVHRGMYSQHRPERDVSFWRRQGQDFNTLLDYADFRDPRGKATGVPLKAEGMQRRPESALSAEEHNRERQRRVDSARARERELALYQWRMAAERKYQSLGTEEWRPAMGISRHASESEGERWAQEQHRSRIAEGAVPPRTKAKSQSLPRMAMLSDSMQYLSLTSPDQDPSGNHRQNGHQSRVLHSRSLQEGESRDRRIENRRSGAQSAPPSKPRFSRPLRPPSYEDHQQMRGSSEMLSGEFMSHSRDRTPLPFTKQDYFAQDTGESGTDPPGYIPPPSYRRQSAVRGGQRTYVNSMGSYQYRGDPYMGQGPAMAEVQEWFLRQTGMVWPEHYRDGRRSMPCRRQVYPAFSEERMRNVQYIPFDDPRVRHISGEGMDGNSLTDADKIRNIRKDVPLTSLEKPSGDSAFPLSGKSFSSTEATKSNIRDCANEAAIPMEISGAVISTKAITDENSNRYPASHDYSSTFQITSQQRSISDQGLCETVTQVKTFEAQTAAENKKNKKKIKETMFCLVSVPISMLTSKEAADPNNNDKIPSLVVAPRANSLTKPCSNDLSMINNNNEQVFAFTSSSTAKSSKRAPLSKEIVDVWSLQTSADKELFYAGSWPGEQYKNQETQTGSSEVSRNTHPQSSHSKATYDPPSSDSGIGSESSAISKCPMKVQKTLSSNSAFSQTRKESSSNVKSSAEAPIAPPPSSPRRQNQLKGTEPKSQAPDGQEVFGQFLLKPVNRRPWDAIGELESINKELQDLNSKQQNIDQSIEDLDEALKSILEISNTSREYSRPESLCGEPVALHNLNKNIQSIERSPEQQLKNDFDISSGFERRVTAEADKEFRERRSAFSQPHGRFENPSVPQRHEMPVLKESDFVNYEVFHTIHDVPGVNRLDIPVAKESLLKDVGLTVYTAIPDTVTSGSPGCLSPESPMLTSPSDISETCEALQITSSDSGGDQGINSPDFSIDHQTSNSHDHKRKMIPNSQRSPPIYCAKNAGFRFKANQNDDAYDDELYFDYLSWSKEKTVADEHLEALLSQEKANSLPMEDFSNLYQIQCAQGIPVHESIEQRAARILGIAVPMEALVVSQDDEEEGEENGKEITKGSTEQSAFVIQTSKVWQNEETQHVIRETTKVTETSVHSHELMEMKDIIDDTDSRENKPNVETHTVSLVLELPEFPPTNLRLSLPATEDVDLAQSVCGGEKKVTLESDVAEEPSEELIAYYQSSACRNEELSAQHSNPGLKDESMSSSNGFGKKIYNIKEAEKIEEDRIENRVQEDKVLDEEEQFVEKAVRTSEWDAEARQKIDEYDDSRTREGEEKEPTEETEQSQKMKTYSVPVPQPRNGTVAKREITLLEAFRISDSAEDDDIQSGSDTYDPSRVERV